MKPKPNPNVYNGDVGSTTAIGPRLRHCRSCVHMGTVLPTLLLCSASPSLHGVAAAALTYAAWPWLVILHTRVLPCPPCGRAVGLSRLAVAAMPTHAARYATTPIADRIVIKL